MPLHLVAFLLWLTVYPYSDLVSISIYLLFFLKRLQNTIIITIRRFLAMACLAFRSLFSLLLNLASLHWTFWIHFALLCPTHSISWYKFLATHCKHGCLTSSEPWEDISRSRRKWISSKKSTKSWEKKNQNTIQTWIGTGFLPEDWLCAGWQRNSIAW